MVKKSHPLKSAYQSKFEAIRDEYLRRKAIREGGEGARGAELTIQELSGERELCGGLNALKRATYSEVELLRLDMEEEMDTGDDGKNEEREAVLAAMTEFTNNELPLDFVHRDKCWWDKLDELVRACAVWLCLSAFAITLALPIILIRPFEDIVINMGLLPSKWALSNVCKWTVAHLLMIMSGIKMKVKGASDETFSTDKPILVCYTHTSTMDAFIISAAIPVRFAVLAKLELFFIPFFSWLLIAFGGVPVNRSNRKQSVHSLQAAARGLAPGDAISMAPEGTRSTIGQLLSFKKGAGHLWQQLDARVVPMIIFGAYEMFPLGKLVSIPGHVHVHFLPPFDPETITSGMSKTDHGGEEGTRAQLRAKMSIKLRRDMLTELAKQPPGVGDELSWSERLLNVGAVVLFFSMLVYLYTGIRVVVDFLGITALQAAMYGFLGSCAITLVLFVWVMYGIMALALVAAAGALCAQLYSNYP